MREEERGERKEGRGEMKRDGEGDRLRGIAAGRRGRRQKKEEEEEWKRRRGER